MGQNAVITPHSQAKLQNNAASNAVKGFGATSIEQHGSIVSLSHLHKSGSAWVEPEKSQGENSEETGA